MEFQYKIHCSKCKNNFLPQIDIIRYRCPTCGNVIKIINDSVNVFAIRE